MIYSLSAKLGGRESVIQTPFVELLSYLISKIEEDIREAEDEQNEYYMNYIAMLNSNPQSKEDMNNVKKFMKMIEPRKFNLDNNVKFNDNKPQWNKRVQEKIEAKKREKMRSDK